MDQKLVQCFVDSLGIEKSGVKDTLKYNAISEWDSIGHMALVAKIEEVYGITLDTDDILDMSSVKKTKEILDKYTAKHATSKK